MQRAEEVTLKSCFEATRSCFGKDFIISNSDKMTSELAPPSSNFRATPTERRFPYIRFKAEITRSIHDRAKTGRRCKTPMEIDMVWSQVYKSNFASNPFRMPGIGTFAVKPEWSRSVLNVQLHMHLSQKHGKSSVAYCFQPGALRSQDLTTRPPSP
ncbi:hypothetical protein AVEN_231876-1 [Araneus ventricosus]|uniref:Uncharacterized protein n=1 Tax=Araneus ventricosus TaxID=182803 RepID=A0A4Y2KY74_ARAVE|nr:hypothetical protein AVEN_231876-1 [Araneus ventricosus]